MQNNLGFKIDRAQLLPLVSENPTGNTERSFNSIAGTMYPAEIVELFINFLSFCAKTLLRERKFFIFNHSQIGQNDTLNFS